MVIAASGMEPTKIIVNRPETMEEIIVAYKKMATIAMNKNDTMSAEHCLSIAEDIEMLRKRGHVAGKNISHILSSTN